MFGRTKIMKSTGNYSDDIKRLKKAVEEADAAIIGAGAGLSTSAGFTYSGERFEKHFSEFGKKYGFKDMYSGGFYPYETPEEMWAYWSKFIFVNRYMDAPKPVYEHLLSLVKDKDYFVITTNVDHCFQKAGFDKKRLFYTQGDYGLFQCSEPCSDVTYENEEMVRNMVEQQKDMKIPKDLIPKCPKCGKPFTMNLRSDDKFVEDKGWHEAAARYREFMHSHVCPRTMFGGARRGFERLQRNSQEFLPFGKILYLELGVGYNTPGIIKYPFWQMTADNPDATYACVNYGEAVCPEDIREQAICINGDIGTVIDELRK